MVSLRWSTEPPSVPGWYWLKFGDRIDIREFTQEVVNRLTEDQKSDMWAASLLIGRVAWAGPIPAPLEAN